MSDKYTLDLQICRTRKEDPHRNVAFGADIDHTPGGDQQSIDSRLSTFNTCVALDLLGRADVPP